MVCVCVCACVRERRVVWCVGDEGVLVCLCVEGGVVGKVYVVCVGGGILGCVELCVDVWFVCGRQTSTITRVQWHSLQ
jgi:hypothetical protein